MASKKDLEKLASEASRCRNCDLYKNATQVVFGKGSVRSKIMIVGEQPGHMEDLAGEPFVGPAGQLLKSCMAKAEMSDTMVYLTNAVKHFKFHKTTTGKRRLHDKPNMGEVHACHPWLEKEMEMLKPKIILALGLTAARSVLNRPAVLNKERGTVLKELPSGEAVILSWHPSAILRSYDSEKAEKMKQQLIDDLKLAVKTLKKL